MNRRNLTDRAYVWEVYAIALVLVAGSLALFAMLNARIDRLENRPTYTVTIRDVRAADVPVAMRGLLPDLSQAREAQR